jgi:hypothetical protein
VSSSPSILRENFLPMDLFDQATGHNNNENDPNRNVSKLFTIIETQLMTASLFMLLNLTKEVRKKMNFSDDKGLSF